MKGYDELYSMGCLMRLGMETRKRLWGISGQLGFLTFKIVEASLLAFEQIRNESPIY